MRTALRPTPPPLRPPRRTRPPDFVPPLSTRSTQNTSKRGQRSQPATTPPRPRGGGGGGALPPAFLHTLPLPSVTPRHHTHSPHSLTPIMPPVVHLPLRLPATPPLSLSFSLFKSFPVSLFPVFSSHGHGVASLWFRCVLSFGPLLSRQFSLHPLSIGLIAFLFHHSTSPRNKRALCEQSGRQRKSPWRPLLHAQHDLQRCINHYLTVDTH